MNPCAYADMCKDQQKELELAKIALEEARQILVYYNTHPQGARLDFANKKRQWVLKYGTVDKISRLNND